MSAILKSRTKLWAILAQAVLESELELIEARMTKKDSHKPTDDNTAKLGGAAKAQAEAIDDNMAMRLAIGYGYNGMKVNMK